MPPTFSTTQAVVDAIAAEFTAQSIQAEVHLGNHLLAQRKDARLGQIVIVPAAATFPGRRFAGKDQRFSAVQELAVHVVAKAPANAAVGLTPEQRRARQYGDDLTYAERLRNVFLAVVALKLPLAPDTEATQVLTEAGENAFGVEIILGLKVVLDAPDVTYSPNVAPDETVFDTSCAAVMPGGETVECCEAEAPAPAPPDP